MAARWSIVLQALSLWAIPSANAETTKLFKVDRITSCDPSKNYTAVLLPNYSVSSNSGENVFNCTLRISEEIEGPLKYTATIQRCEMDLSKCEFFNTIETDTLCELLSDPTFIERFMKRVSPPVTCPTKPGDYVFLNNKWDLSAVVRLPGSAYRWNIVTTVDQTATGRTVYCSEMMARIVVLRKKNNRIKH